MNMQQIRSGARLSLAQPARKRLALALGYALLGQATPTTSERPNGEMSSFKTHIALNVSSIKKSVDFDRTMLDRYPVKYKADYAKARSLLAYGV